MLAVLMVVLLGPVEPVLAQTCPQPKGQPPGTFEVCEPTEFPDGTITATPVVCTIPAGSTVCTSTVSWTTVDTSSSVVEVVAVSQATGVSSLFSSLKNGSQVVTWIDGPGTRFDLKINTQVFDSVLVRGNRAPTVSLTSPANGASFTPPASITL
ncbi:MAG TPA: hypothetical protein DDZ76_15300, partial [Xanthomonadales bacterium]|nr:hypothetical protein [Xanthomonadales bacterium]